jgi:hypothetical protein
MIVTTRLWTDLTGMRKPGIQLDRPCAACGETSDEGLHRFIPSGNFADYHRFLGPDGYLCADCYPVLMYGDRADNPWQGQSWVLSADRRTPVPLAEAKHSDFWRETLLHPPTPPFVLTWQMAKAVRYLLLFKAVPGLNHQWFPIAFGEYHVAWVSPTLLTTAFERLDLLHRERAIIRAGKQPSHPDLHWLGTWTIEQRLLLSLILPPRPKRKTTRIRTTETTDPASITLTDTRGTAHVHTAN